jgi:hypothetical protein
MAIPCQGFTFTWGGSALLEIKEMELNLTRGLPQGRSVVWTSQNGDVRLLSLARVNLPDSEYGKRRTLNITCPVSTSGGTVTLLNVDCIYQDTLTNASANDAVQFAHVFKVMDTVGAPSNP